jgi:glutathione peroxidase
MLMYKLNILLLSTFYKKMEYMDKLPNSSINKYQAIELMSEFKNSSFYNRGLCIKRNVFSGKNFIKWLMSINQSHTIESAVEIGQSMLNNRIAHQINDESIFKNENIFYKFYIDEPTKLQKESELYDSILSKSILYGYVKIQIKNSIFGHHFNDAFMMLTKNSSSNDVDTGCLYLYRSTSAMTPFAIFKVQNCICTMKEKPNCLKDWYCFTIHSNEMISKKNNEITISTKNSKQMETWMSHLQEGGIEFSKMDEGDIQVDTIFDLQGNDLDTNEIIPFSTYRGKVCLIVNVSSKCGLTPKQYPELVQLHKTYSQRGLVILAFPCNQFNNQEPGTNKEIRLFVDKEYGVEFQMLSKVDVNGKNAHPVFKYLKKNLPGVLGSSIKWNFTKFLCDRNGKPIKRYMPMTR